MGKGNTNFTGYFYVDLMQNYFDLKDNNTKKKFFSDLFSYGNNKFVITDLKENIDMKNYNLNLTYDFSINDYIVLGQNDSYVNLNLFNAVRDKFKKTDRYSKYFKKKAIYTYYVTLHIPEGYKLTYIPSNSAFDDPFFNYRIEYGVSENVVTYVLTIAYNTLMLEPKDFSHYNLLMERMQKSFRENLTLTKIQ
jgi:hypothetical protein